MTPTDMNREAHPLDRLLGRVVPWEWDADADRIVASAALADVYGVSALERVSHGMRLVHPDDLDSHQTRVLEAVDRGRGYRSSFRIVRPDTHEVVLIDERAEAIQRRQPLPPLLIGIAFDASVRRESAAAPRMVEALDALERFGDAMLGSYATGLRADPRRSQTVAPGEWIRRASRELSRLREIPVSDVASFLRVVDGAAAAQRRRS